MLRLQKLPGTALAIWLGMLAVMPGTALASANQADAVTASAALIGRWESENRSFEVAIEACGEALCGTIVRDLTNPSPGADTKEVRPVIGWKLLREFRPGEKGEWLGEMHNFRNGKQYDCVMTLLSPAELLVRPYVGIRLIGKDHVWHRVAEAKVSP